MKEQYVRKKTAQWFYVCIGHALLGIPICFYIYGFSIELAIGTTIFLYLLSWYFYPGGFYRKIFLAVLAVRSGLFLSTVVNINITTYLSKFWLNVSLNIQNNDWVDSMCWCVIKIVLLILDYLSRGRHR